jgi:hypothetical protein
MGQFNRLLKAIQYKYASKLDFDDPVANFAISSLTERINVCLSHHVEDVKSNLNSAFVYSNQDIELPRFGEVTFAGFGKSSTNDVLRMVCDEENIPLKSELYDCSISFLTLNWCNDLRSTFFGCHTGALGEHKRILRKNSVLVGVLFGSGTAVELKKRLEEIQGKYKFCRNHMSPTACTLNFFYKKLLK